MEIYELGEFELACGVVLPDAKLAYQTLGQLNAAKDNAILFPTFLGAPPQGLQQWIGPGRPLDPERYFIVCPLHFGLPPSSSPSNTPVPFDRGAFPRVRIADDVAAQHRLLTEKFGIQELQLVLGWSVGALQAYHWAIQFPAMVKRLASIAGAPRPSPWTRLWLHSALEEPITGDPGWRDGFYQEAGAVQAGLRHLAHVTALTLPPEWFFREGEEPWRGLAFTSMEDVVARFFEAFWLPQDPNDIVTQARKAQAADPGSGADLATTLARITARTAVLAFRGDVMFPPADAARDAALIPGADFREIASNFGHLATFALSDKDVTAVDDALRDLLAT
jgi:homoserine O-acetyltransferase